MTITAPVIRYHGGKFRLAPWVMVALSGYSNEIYQDLLTGWTMNTVNARISAGRGAGVRQECLWLNPACMNALHQTGLQLEVTP